MQNIVELKYRDKEDGKVYDFSVNLDELEPEIDPNHKNVVDLDGNIGIKLKEPTIGLLEELDIGQADLNDNVYELLAGCIEQVYDSEQVYDEFTKEEAIEFITSLDINMFSKIKDFFDTLPKLTHTFEYVNSTGSERKIVLQGLQDFF